MPIVDILLVVPCTENVPAGLAQAVADVVGQLFESPSGHTWVRASTLAAANYAENGASRAQDDLPAFVTVLLAAPPEGEARAIQARRICAAVALAVGRDRNSVHFEYAAAGRGHLAFGGVLVE